MHCTAVCLALCLPDFLHVDLTAIQIKLPGIAEEKPLIVLAGIRSDKQEADLFFL
jgi:hypothetical protein